MREHYFFVLLKYLRIFRVYVFGANCVNPIRKNSNVNQSKRKGNIKKMQYNLLLLSSVVLFYATYILYSLEI